MAQHEEYIPRLVDQSLDALMGELPAIMLTGPRGCGKTTTALRRAQSVIRLDQPDQAEAFRAGPDSVLRAHKPPVLIDEWQRAPESMGAIKRAVDARGGAGRFLVTGSVRASVSGAAWPATGRVVLVPMFGLTEGELEASPSSPHALDRLFGPEDPSPGTLADAPDLVDYVDRIVRGGLPDAIHLSDFSRAAWYESYVEQFVHRDIPEVTEVRPAPALADLLKAIAYNTAGTPAMASLARASSLNHRTVKSYLDLMEDLRIVESLPAWGTNRFSRMAKTPKLHIVDPGMAAHLVGDNRAGLLASASHLGRLIDTFTMAQIRPLLRLRSPKITAYHLRDANGDREIDLVLQSASGDVVALEIKATATVPPRSARHLAWLRDSLGSAFIRGMVLHTGTMTFPMGDKLWAMPIARLWRD
ncbi:MAG: DUF4143 domain-containing protein [Micrococcales bacterium]|nr:DUF4143 domain-containing protein [Micrococcales bacterium]